MTYDSPQEQLSHLFGSYKAEWLREEVFDLFTKPAYFPELETPRPCMLIGGRGTGKTTVLRCLSYEGKFALSNRNPDAIQTWPYYGLYYRVNPNRVTAFRGSELPDAMWTRVFAHYFNLLVCGLIIRFLDWFELQCPDRPRLDHQACARIATSFNLPDAQGSHELGDLIETTRLKFEARINNIADDQENLGLSMQGVPIDTLVEAVTNLPQFRGKCFFFLIDEYENFEDYQQQIVNTLIKHSAPSYTFKVGVRELGWRRRTTLNENEQLISPADYVRIGIAEKLQGEAFRAFALQVCDSRVSRLSVSNEKVQAISTSLPTMSEDQEAELLGILPISERIKAQLLEVTQLDEKVRIQELTPLELYFLDFWARSKQEDLKRVWEEADKDLDGWRRNRFENYKHALLYTIRRRRRGIRKYYSGWNVFVQLAAGNIRYLLELVEQSLLLHLGKHDRRLSEPLSAEIQTTAAQYVAEKNLKELEGLSVHGARLTKLLLGLGRVFGVMAAEVEGHAPEVNHFHVNGSGGIVPSASDDTDADQLLAAGVMHLALLRWPGNKLADERETRAYDYMIHPIFTPFFLFSYRKKRKMALSADDLIGLVREPRDAIRTILSRNNREGVDPLPDQLDFFGEYYGGSRNASDS